MQTRVPDANANWIEDEAFRRGVECPDFFREVIAAGIQHLRSCGDA
jgi:hypothetical protein